ASERLRGRGEATRYDLEKFLGDKYLAICRCRVDSRELTGGIEAAEESFQPLELVHRAINRMGQCVRVVVAPRHDLDQGAHNVACRADFFQFLYSVSHITRAFLMPLQNARDERVAPVTPMISEPTSKRSELVLPRN